MSKVTQEIRNRIRKENAALLIEATLVYPIMLFVLLVLMYMGNMFYLNAKINSIVSREALAYSQRFADPNFENFQNGVPISSKGNTELTGELYRYIDIFNLGDYGVANNAVKDELAKEIENTGFYAGMVPTNVTVTTHRVHNYVVYQTYEVEVTYQLKLPVKFMFTGNPMLLNLTARDECPIVDTSEFIRNVDMAVDYLERTKTGENLQAKLQESYERIDQFINGQKRNPSEAVAGGIKNIDLSDPNCPYEKDEQGKYVLKPNNAYSVNGYDYVTDSQGRIISAGGELHLGSAPRDNYAQRTVGGEDRKSTDDGGHLIASRFGGDGGIDNMVPMDSSVNRRPGEWYMMEEEWANKLKENPPVKVEVKIEVVYSGDSKRPTSYIVTSYYDGVQQGEPKHISNN